MTPPLSSPIAPSRNDAPSLQHLLDKGGIIRLEPGATYQIAKALTVTGPNIVIDGQGATITCLASMPIDSQTGAGDALMATHCPSLTIRNVRFVGNAAQRGHAETAVSLRLFDCSDFKVVDCNFADAICDHLYLAASNAQDDATACHDGVIDGCTFDGAWRNAVSVIHGHDLTFRNNTIRTVTGTRPGAGFDVEANPSGSNADCDQANHDILIVGNRIEGCDGAGVQVPGVLHPSRIRVIGNSICRCGLGVSFPDDGTTDNRIIDNEIYSVAGVGIAAAGTGSIVTGNRVTASGQWGMYVSGGGHTITGNTLVDSPVGDRCLVCNSHALPGGNIIANNVVRKTVADTAHVAITANADDQCAGNLMVGCAH